MVIAGCFAFRLELSASPEGSSRSRSAFPGGQCCQSQPVDQVVDTVGAGDAFDAYCQEVRGIAGAGELLALRHKLLEGGATC